MKCVLGPFFLGALLTVHLTAVLTSFGPGYQTDDILRPAYTTSPITSSAWVHLPLVNKRGQTPETQLPGDLKTDVGRGPGIANAMNFIIEYAALVKPTENRRKTQ